MSAKEQGKTWVNPSLPAGESGVEFIRPSRLAADHEAGTTKVVLEGIFEGTVENPMTPDKQDFKLKREDGSVAIINNSGNLGYKMQNVNPGDYIQIQYSGKKELLKGKFKGKLAHDFTVLVAE